MLIIQIPFIWSLKWHYQKPYFLFSSEIQCSLNDGTVPGDTNFQMVSPKNENGSSLMEIDSDFQHIDTDFKDLDSYNAPGPIKITTSTATIKNQLNNHDKIINFKLNSDGIQDCTSLGTVFTSSDTYDSRSFNSCEFNKDKMDSQNLSKYNNAFKNPGQLEVQTKEEQDLPKNIPCLLCKTVDFPSLYEYQRHLALSHFKDEISAIYLADQNETKFTCTVCLGDSNRTMTFAYRTFLIIHLATYHNCCLEFASKTIINQLKNVQES